MKQITQFVFARLEYDFKDLFCSRFLTILFLTHLFFLQSSFSLFFFSLLLLLLQTVSLKIFISKYIISLIWSLAEQIYRIFFASFHYMIPVGRDEILSRFTGFPTVLQTRQCYILRLHVKGFISARWDPSFVPPGSRFAVTKFFQIVTSFLLSGMKKWINTLLSTFQYVKDISNVSLWRYIEVSLRESMGFGKLIYLQRKIKRKGI